MMCVHPASPARHGHCHRLAGMVMVAVMGMEMMRHDFVCDCRLPQLGGCGEKQSVIEAIDSDATKCWYVRMALRDDNRKRVMMLQGLRDGSRISTLSREPRFLARQNPAA